MLRQGDAQVFKKYSQMKLKMKREALEKLNRRVNEMLAEKAGAQSDTVTVQWAREWQGFDTVEAKNHGFEVERRWKVL
jgi:hypothetical protein